MKVCYVGGNAPLLYKLMEDMKNRGHEVHWICFDIPSHTIEGITVHRELEFFSSKLKRRNVFIFYYLIIFKRIIRELSPDIIHAINVKWAGWFSVLSKVKPVIVTAQGGDVMLRRHYDRDFIRTRLRKYTLKNADVVTYGSEVMLRDIKFWAKPKRSFKYFQGVNFEKFNFDLTPVDLFKKLNLGDKKIVFSPRMYEPNSNIDIIIQTIPIVKEYFPNIIYMFCTHLEINNYSDEMRKLIAELNVEDYCLFLGKIPLHEMVNYYAISDLVVSILSSDGMPATVLEAMAMKKSLVLTKIPTYSEIMRQNYALMVNPKDIEVTADAIIRGLSNGKQLESMRERAYEWVRENGNSRVLNDNIEKLYEELIS
jgi:glycosyltransferase involved in cell wall biosynthesis